MKILKFEGSNMREAVAKVKAELGDQAVIVSTRQIRRGLIGGTAYEISAAIDDDDDNEPVRLPRGFGALAHAAGPGDGPAARSCSATCRATRSSACSARCAASCKSLRALVRAQSGDNRATAELRNEVASLRKLVEDLAKTAPPPPSADRTARAAPRRSRPRS